MTEHTQPHKFNAGNWGQFARLAVAASVTLSAVTVAILLMADPPNQCPNWHLKNPHSTSLWQCVGMLTAPLNIFVASLPFAGTGSPERLSKVWTRGAKRCSAL
jgi:hypothetical protein